MKMLNIKRRRHSDVIISTIKNVAQKLIDTTKKYIDKFKKINANEKLIVILLKIQQIAINISVAKDLKEAARYAKKILYWKKVIEREKEKNINFSPSIDSPYAKNNVKLILKGISIIVKLITLLASKIAEDSIINKEDEMIVTHDSMPWSKRKHVVI